MEKGRNEGIVIDNLPNVDPITSLPYETPEVRKRLISRVMEVISTGKSVYFWEMDLNGLKGLNDRYGHETGNRAIRRFAEEKVRLLEEAEEVEAFYFYRPQAGGDEFKAVIIGGEKEEIREKMKEEVEMGEIRLRGSVGMAESRKEGETPLTFEETAKIFGEMEEEAKNLLDEEKRERVKKTINELIEQVGAETSEKILKKIATVLAENRRLSEKEIAELLRILLVTARAEGRQRR